MNVDIDARELSWLAKDLSGAAVRLIAPARASIARGAHDVKSAWAENARASSGNHAPRYPESITYDLERGGLSAVIGPDKDRPQGALGNLLEFGSVKNPAHDDGGRALLAEQSKLEKVLADLAAEAVLGDAR